MKSSVVFSLVNTLLIASAAHADVTMRSKMDYRLGSFVPPAAAEMMKKQMEDTAASGVTTQVKGTHSLTSSGQFLILMDQDKGTVTMVDPKGKRYATVPLDGYAESLKGAMPTLPPEARQMLDNMKIDVKTDKTGQTATIKGIKAEEMLITITMDMPGPMAAMGSMKMEMHLWPAVKEELGRVPALKEIADYMSSKAAGVNMASTFSKMFSALPGLGEKLKGPIEEMMKASSQAVLRTEIKMIMPGSSKMMGATNPDEPLTVITTEVAELTSDPIPDSVFQVPADYQSAPVEDLVRSMNPMRQMGQPQQ
jgi:hypothetical protein